MKIPTAPAMVRRSAAAKRAWRNIWRLLDAHEMADDRFAPMVAVLSMQLGLAEDAADAVFNPIDPATGKRFARTLAEYLAGEDGEPRNSQTAQELTVLRDSLRQAAAVAKEFGMSPAALAKIGGVEKAPTESPMMAYIRAANERMKNRKAAS